MMWTLQQRIAQLRQSRLLSLPHLLPTATDVHEKRLAAADISSREKRELLLQQNRQRMIALQQKPINPTALPKQQEMLHLSEDVLVKIVDIKLPGSSSRTTFEPAPLSKEENSAMARRQHKEQKRREAQLELSSSSHRGVVGSSMHRAAGTDAQAASSAPQQRITPEEGAREFSRAMASIKQMPQIGRAQMDAYKGLLEDWLATQPFDPALAQPSTHTPKVPPMEEPRDTVVIPGKEHLKGSAQENEAAEEPASLTQTPHLYSKAPNVNIKRRKQKPVITGDAAAASSTSAVSASAVAAAAPADSSALPTAGGLPYDPSTLVPTTGMSLHGSKGLTQQPSTGMEDDVSTPAGSEDSSSEYVWDVYHIPDDEASAGVNASPNPCEIGGAGPQHQHGANTAVPLATITTGESTHGDEYKAKYDGASSAYVVLHDGVLEWMGTDELVQEDELAAEDEGEYDDEDPDAREIDYSDEDTSAEEEHADRPRYSHEYDDPDDVPFKNAAGSYDPPPLTPLDQLHSLRQIKLAEPRKHGFYPDGPHDDEDEDEDVQDGQSIINSFPYTNEYAESV
jgi:hypothetical protein